MDNIDLTGSLRDGMTKAQLVEEVARNTQLTKKHAEIIVNTVFESIVDSLKDGEKIELRGFGSFRIRERGSRIGRNPKTGDRVDVPSKRIPYFKPGKQLKELLNSDGCFLFDKVAHSRFSSSSVAMIYFPASPLMR